MWDLKHTSILKIHQKKLRLNVGDHSRLSKYKNTFAKGNRMIWT